MGWGGEGKEKKKGKGRGRDKSGGEKRAGEEAEMIASYFSPSSCSGEDLFSAQGVRVHSIKQIFESY